MMSGACGEEFRVLAEDGEVEDGRGCGAQHLEVVFDFGFSPVIWELSVSCVWR